MPRATKTIEERFWEKVDQGGEHECWTWTGSRLPDGYGCFWDGTYRAPRRPRLVRAHRWAYERFIGPIPTGVEVCHSCDSPSCVNYLRHLFLGSHADNMRDSALKGRQGVNAGEQNGRAKLTAELVAQIRAESTGRYGEVSEFARRLGVSSATISKVLKRQIWP